jgi:amidohydrolase
MSVSHYHLEAEGLRPQLVSWRRELHQHPEQAFEEHATAALVEEELRGLGLEVCSQVAGTGVLGLLRGGQAGPTVMLRADMDALPIQEANDVPYASCVPGCMHACGHDGHVAMALGAARLLTRHSAELPGQVMFLFQPAEERMGGAAEMIKAGVLTAERFGTAPEAAYGLHLWNSLAVGRVCIQPGPLMSAADTLRIVVRGRGGHGALPHETVDAIAVTGQILSALQTIISRNVDPQETAVLSIGMVQGGTAYNVIAETVELLGTIRTFSPAVRETVLTRLQVLLNGISNGMGARYDLEVRAVAPGVVNDAELTELAQAAAVQVAGSGALTRLMPLMASEDFAEYQQRIPGCFMLLGSQNNELGFNAPHHNPHFDFDERALPSGAALLAAVATRYLADRAGRHAQSHPGPQ